MTRRLMVAGLILLTGCSFKPGPIQWQQPGESAPAVGPVKAGQEVILSVAGVSTSDPVTYRWNSLDGGSFDNVALATPRFTVPQQRQVRIECLVTAGSSQRRIPAVLNVILDAGQKGSDTAGPVATGQNTGG